MGMEKDAREAVEAGGVWLLREGKSARREREIKNKKGEK